MKIIRNNIIPPKGFAAITIGNYIFVRKNIVLTNYILNHEKIHITQEKELAYIGFYIIYVLEFIYRYIKYHDKYLAYRQISFEQEAYANESNWNYLIYRKRYSWWKYRKCYKR